MFRKANKVDRRLWMGMDVVLIDENTDTLLRFYGSQHHGGSGLPLLRVEWIILNEHEDPEAVYDRGKYDIDISEETAMGIVGIAEDGRPEYSFKGLLELIS